VLSVSKRPDVLSASDRSAVEIDCMYAEHVCGGIALGASKALLHRLHEYRIGFQRMWDPIRRFGKSPNEVRSGL